MVYSECGLFNKVSDPLKVQLALDCIVADTVSTKFTYLCIIQETKSWYVNYKMQNVIFQSSSNFMHGKKQNTNLVYLHIHLVKTFALILNSKSF